MLGKHISLDFQVSTNKANIKLNNPLVLKRAVLKLFLGLLDGFWN